MGTLNVLAVYCDLYYEIVLKRLSTGESCTAFSSGPAAFSYGCKASFRHICFITRAHKVEEGGRGDERNRTNLLQAVS